MPTKEQEKQALAKIEKILASLGNNPETSYVCRAFQGCVDDARRAGLLREARENGIC